MKLFNDFQSYQLNFSGCYLDYFKLIIIHFNHFMQFREIEKVNETFGLDLPESDDYLTVGGLILNRYQSFPKLHEVIAVDKYQFKIIKVTATKIELVRLKVTE